MKISMITAIINLFSLIQGQEPSTNAHNSSEEERLLDELEEKVTKEQEEYKDSPEKYWEKLQIKLIEASEEQKQENQNQPETKNTLDSLKDTTAFQRDNIAKLKKSPTVDYSASRNPDYHGYDRSPELLHVIEDPYVQKVDKFHAKLQEPKKCPNACPEEDLGYKTKPNAHAFENKKAESERKEEEQNQPETKNLLDSLKDTIAFHRDNIAKLKKSPPIDFTALKILSCTGLYMSQQPIHQNLDSYVQKVDKLDAKLQEYKKCLNACPEEDLGYKGKPNTHEFEKLSTDALLEINTLYNFLHRHEETEKAYCHLCKAAEPLEKVLSFNDFHKLVEPFYKFAKLFYKYLDRENGRIYHNENFSIDEPIQNPSNYNNYTSKEKAHIKFFLIKELMNATAEGVNIETLASLQKDFLKNFTNKQKMENESLEKEIKELCMEEKYEEASLLARKSHDETLKKFQEQHEEFMKNFYQEHPGGIFSTAQYQQQEPTLPGPSFYEKYRKNLEECLEEY